MEAKKCSTDKENGTNTKPCDQVQPYCDFLVDKFASSKKNENMGGLNQTHLIFFFKTENSSYTLGITLPLYTSTNIYYIKRTELLTTSIGDNLRRYCCVDYHNIEP